MSEGNDDFSKLSTGSRRSPAYGRHVAVSSNGWLSHRTLCFPLAVTMRCPENPRYSCGTVPCVVNEPDELATGWPITVVWNSMTTVSSGWKHVPDTVITVPTGPDVGEMEMPVAHPAGLTG